MKWNGIKDIAESPTRRERQKKEIPILKFQIPKLWKQKNPLIAERILYI
jgi:hypothetical protein